MSRLPLPDLSTLTPRQQTVVNKIRSAPERKGRLPVPYQLSLANPEFTDAWQQMGVLLRYRSSLLPRLSELAILVTARAWNCGHEWNAHAPAALAAGLDEGAIEEIRWARVPTLTDPSEQVVFSYAAQLNESRTVDAATHRAALNQLGQIGVVDLTALLGYYAMVAMALNAHDHQPAQQALPELPTAERRFSPATLPQDARP